MTSQEIGHKNSLGGVASFRTREAHERIVVLGWDSHLLEVASRKEAQHLQVPNLLLEKHRSVPAEADRL